MLLLLLAAAACSDPANTDKSGSAPTDAPKAANRQDDGPPAQAQLDEAKSKGQVAFFVLTSDDTTGNSRAVAIAERVRQQTNNTAVIKVNRDNAANAPVIEKWQLSSIPTPAIFIISAKGVPVTSFSLEEATESAIIRDIPSPKMEDAYVALDEKKPVFILVSKNAAKDREKALTSCKAANEALKTKAALIEVDQEDAKERTLLDNFKIAPTANTATVIVLNADGETTGTFTGGATVKQLTEAATKVVKAKCCADGEPCK